MPLVKVDLISVFASSIEDKFPNVFKRAGVALEDFVTNLNRSHRTRIRRLSVDPKEVERQSEIENGFFYTIERNSRGWYDIDLCATMLRQAAARKSEAELQRQLVAAASVMLLGVVRKHGLATVSERTLQKSLWPLDRVSVFPGLHKSLRARMDNELASVSKAYELEIVLKSMSLDSALTAASAIQSGIRSRAIIIDDVSFVRDLNEGHIILIGARKPLLAVLPQIRQSIPPGMAISARIRRAYADTKGLLVRIM